MPDAIEARMTAVDLEARRDLGIQRLHSEAGLLKIMGVRLRCPEDGAPEGFDTLADLAGMDSETSREILAEVVATANEARKDGRDAEEAVLGSLKLFAKRDDTKDRSILFNGSLDTDRVAAAIDRQAQKKTF